METTMHIPESPEQEFSTLSFEWSWREVSRGGDCAIAAVVVDDGGASHILAQSAHD